MVYELDVLEIRRLAELAAGFRRVRDRLMEKVPESGFGEPKPQRGAHNPAGDVALNAVLADTRDFVALRDAIAALPRDIREKAWVVAEIGCGRRAILDTEAALAEASLLSDEAIAGRLLEDPDLHDVLHKGLYELGAATLPGETT
jgi:hypothetical protein